MFENFCPIAYDVLHCGTSASEMGCRGSEWRKSSLRILECAMVHGGLGGC